MSPVAQQKSAPAVVTWSGDIPNSCRTPRTSTCANIAPPPPPPNTHTHTTATRFNYSSYLYLYGEVLEANSDFDKAVSAYQEAKRVFECHDIIPYERDFYGSVLVAWGLALKRSNRFGEALAAYEHAMRVTVGCLKWTPNKTLDAIKTNIRSCKNAMSRGFADNSYLAQREMLDTTARDYPEGVMKGMQICKFCGWANFDNSGVKKTNRKLKQCTGCRR